VLGDFSGDLDKGGFSIGVVGINTAVNQGGHDSPQWVPFDRQRVESLLRSSVERWADKRRLRLLLTHHRPQDFRFLNWDRLLPAGKGGFQVHFCDSGSGPGGALASSDGVTLIEAPSFSPEAAGRVGYIAGIIDLENVDATSLWQRAYSQDTETWHAADEIKTVSSFPLPVEKPVEPLREPLYIESFRLKGFRCFEELELRFDHESRLEGRWTCIAGINGAGKSSILQALGLVLLGYPLAAELRGGALNRMRRLVNGERQRAELRIDLGIGENSRPIQLPLDLDDFGAYPPASPPPGWDEIRRHVVAGYGATRNLAVQIDHSNEDFSPDVRRLITLFNPLSQLSGAEVLLTQKAEDGPLVPLLQSVLSQVFDADLRIDAGTGGIHFVVAERDHVEAIDLPDGFRAAAAWIADLCAIWCEKAPELAATGNPRDIQAVVLIDEIDLHLHPSLQRKLVPRLRKTFPKVQWIVTTHSPLVLSNFDSAEIIALDRTEPSGVRFLDRQIMGFSANDIYEWLMGTPATGMAMEETIRAAGADPTKQRVAAELLQASPFADDETAKLSVDQMLARLEHLER
jgi:hypothetical protein